jgi:hypothetical protein
MSREYGDADSGKFKRLSEKNRIRIESWLKDGVIAIFLRSNNSG